MIRCIGLGEGVQVSPRQYLLALRAALSASHDKFSQSFRDPRGWMGRSYTGAEIVAQHWEMISDRWAAQWAQVFGYGKGSRASKRAKAIRDRQVECRWCGQKTGGPEFCEASCRRSFYS